jgi:proteasome lid subunit RPN8/RPN11
VSTASVFLPAALRAQIEAEARAAYPRECCGLLVGQRSGERTEIFLAHPALNVAAGDNRFEIDPQAQFTLLRALRGTGREIIGCYHSHPHGRAEPSQKDATGASEIGFIWLIASVTPTKVPALNAFVFDGARFQPTSLHVTPIEKAA